MWYFLILTKLGKLVKFFYQDTYALLLNIGVENQQTNIPDRNFTRFCKMSQSNFYLINYFSA
jgi:hypothetical protein